MHKLHFNLTLSVILILQQEEHVLNGVLAGGNPAPTMLISDKLWKLPGLDMKLEKFMEAIDSK